MSQPSTPTPPPASAGPPRRTFVKWVLGGVSAVAVAAFGVPFIAYLFGPLRKKPPLWVKLKLVSEYPLNETQLVVFDNPIRQPWDGMTAHTGVYVRRVGEDRFLVFAINCTHLGCPVTWFPQSGLFMCPCHGGVYYENGEHASGPPPRGLYHCIWQITKDGHLEVQAPHLPTLQDTLTKNARGSA